MRKKGYRSEDPKAVRQTKPSIIKRLLRSDGFVLLVWIIGMAAVWEIGAFYIARVSPRHPEYILPHLWQIASSFGQSAGAEQTIFGLVMTNAAATLSRAGEGFLIGMALGAHISAVDEPFWGGRQDRVPVPHDHPDDTDTRHGADSAVADRRHREEPRSS